jgi:Subtilase family
MYCGVMKQYQRVFIHLPRNVTHSNQLATFTIMKSKFAYLHLLLFLGPLLGLAQSGGSTYWFDSHGRRQTVYYQRDVFAFRLGGSYDLGSFSPSPLVRRAYTRADDPDQLSIVEFELGYPDSAYEAVKDMLRLLPEFECAFDVVNLAAGRPSNSTGWSAVDDELLVTFRDPSFSTADIAAFESRHGVVLHLAPLAGLPAGYGHCHIFKVAPMMLCESGHRTIDVCREIWETDSARVMVAEPNLVMAVHGTSTDPRYVQQWQVQNTGQPLAYGHAGGTVDADHDIDWVWNQGYRGAGIRVAVIDLDGFDLGHEDMAGAFVDPWNAIFGTALPIGNQIGKYAAHGMCVSGIIGARADNGYGISGIAPECKIVPILVNSSSAILAFGIQRAMVNYDVDSLMVHVLNLSLGYHYTVDNVQNELHIAKKAGRNGRGMVIVASAGNDDLDSSFYPAAYAETISVIANTPDDKRKQSGDGWESVSWIPWGSTYHQTCDVAAGGCFTPTTDFTGQYGYSQNPDSIGNYYVFEGTSAAAPVVAGMCALLLQANPHLVDTMDGRWDVRDAIRNGAEKKHPLLYDYNAFALEPGRSLEMGYGRMNGLNSLALVGTHEQEQAPLANLAVYANRAQEELVAFFEMPPSQKGTVLVISDLQGAQIKRASLSPGACIERINAQGISAGMYLATLENAGLRISNTIRFAYY